MLSKLSPGVANADILLYSVPVTKYSVVNLSVLNRSNDIAYCSIAIVKELDASVSNIRVDKKGFGFTSIPNIFFEDITSDPATPVVDSMSVSDLILDNIGTSYSVDDILELEIANATSTKAASIIITEIDANGSIVNFKLKEGGVYSSVGSTATVIGGSGTGASFTNITYGINSIQLNNLGSGYKSIPELLYTGGNGFSVKIQMSQTPEDDDYIEFDVPIAPVNVLERTGICLSSGQCILIKSSASNSLNAHVWGFEKPVHN